LAGLAPLVPYGNNTEVWRIQWISYPAIQSFDEALSPHAGAIYAGQNDTIDETGIDSTSVKDNSGIKWHHRSYKSFNTNMITNIYIYSLSIVRSGEHTKSG